MAYTPTKFTALQSNNSLRVGSSGDTISAIVSSLKSVSMGAVAANESASTTLTLTGAAVGSAIVINPASSAWSGAYHDLGVSGHVLTADTVTVVMFNSTTTSVTPAAQNFRVTAINF